MAESERSSSDPMNLLVNASVGMWFAEYSNQAMQTILNRPALLFCLYRHHMNFQE